LEFVKKYNLNYAVSISFRLDLIIIYCATKSDCRNFEKL